MKKHSNQVGAVFAMAALVMTLTPIPSAHASKSGIGAIIGAVIGGVGGSAVGSGRGKTVAIIVGAVAGGYLGNKVGKDLDEADEMKAREAYAQSLEGPINRPVRWEGRDRRETYGTITSTQEYYNNYGERCRTYNSETVTRRERTVYSGTSCFGPRGWYTSETTTTTQYRPEPRYSYEWARDGQCFEINGRSRRTVSQDICRDRLGSDYAFEETEYEITCVERTQPRGYMIRKAPLRMCRGGAR